MVLTMAQALKNLNAGRKDASLISPEEYTDTVDKAIAALEILTIHPLYLYENKILIPEMALNQRIMLNRIDRVKEDRKEGIEDTALFDLAIKEKGADDQVHQAIEELNELAVALNHYRRPDRGTGIEEVIEEIADAELGISEMKHMWRISAQAIHDMKVFKKKKLISSIVEAKNEAKP